LGHFDSDGYLYIDGRVKDVINRGGEKVFPAEVESVLLAHPAVYECAVVGRPNPVLGEEVVAFVVAKNLSAIEPELRSLVSAQLSPYKAPAAYLTVKQLPRSGSGKVLRHQLLQGNRPA
jgi:acyl-coenzyme A synthetase/AMP-(fatty) acid ligase